MQDLANTRASIVIFRSFFKIIIESIFERSNRWCRLNLVRQIISGTYCCWNELIIKQVCLRMSIAKIAEISQVICSSILNNWWDKRLEIFRCNAVYHFIKDN